MRFKCFIIDTHIFYSLQAFDKAVQYKNSYERVKNFASFLYENAPHLVNNVSEFELALTLYRKRLLIGYEYEFKPTEHKQIPCVLIRAEKSFQDVGNTNYQYGLDQVCIFKLHDYICRSETLIFSETLISLAKIDLSDLVSFLMSKS